VDKQEFKVGGRVRLVGKGWGLEGGPTLGQIVTIERVLWPTFEAGGIGRFTMGGETWMVWPEPDHMFYAEVVPDDTPVVSLRGLGYLDGSLGIEPTSADDEYVIGHMHGSANRPTLGQREGSL
jgi:hypothetical protein